MESKFQYHPVTLSSHYIPNHLLSVHSIILSIIGCACNPVGSSSDLCQPDVGTCDCLPNVAGPNCSSCNPNYYGLTSGVGCFECTCNEMGKQIKLSSVVFIF